MDLPKFAGRGVDETFEVARHGDIRNVSTDSGVSGAELRDRFVHFTPIAGAQTDMTPFGDQYPAYRPPDAPCAPRHHGDVTGQSEIHGPSPTPAVPTFRS